MIRNSVGCKSEYVHVLLGGAGVHVVGEVNLPTRALTPWQRTCPADKLALFVVGQGVCQKRQTTQGVQKHHGENFVDAPERIFKKYFQFRDEMYFPQLLKLIRRQTIPLLTFMAKPKEDCQSEYST